MICEECNKNQAVRKQQRQRPRGCVFLNVCQDCYDEHEKHLEKLRENFRIQTGGSFE